MLKTIPITVVLLWLLIMYHIVGKFANYWKILGVLRSFCSTLLTNSCFGSVWECRKVDLSQHIAVGLSNLNRQILDEIPAVRMQCHTTACYSSTEWMITKWKHSVPNTALVHQPCVCAGTVLSSLAAWAVFSSTCLIFSLSDWFRSVDEVRRAAAVVGAA